MKIQVSTKSVYGNELTYPECETAKLFAAMLGRKTLTDSDLNYIHKLGYKIELTLGATKNNLLKHVTS